MKLTLRISILLAIVMAVVLMSFELVALFRESELLEADIRRDARLVAESLGALASEGAVGARMGWDLPLLLHDVAAMEDELDISWRGADFHDQIDLPMGVPQQLAAGEVVVTQIRRDGIDTIVAWAPVTGPMGVIGAIEVSESLASRDALVARALFTAASSVLSVTFLTGITAVIAGRALVGRRVDRLVDKTRQVARDDLDQVVEVGGADELTLLAEALNTMSADLARQRRMAEREARARLDAEIALQHADRLRVVGVLAAGVAHELGTPLNVISGRASLIERRAREERNVTDARTIREQSDRIARIVRLLMDFSRASKPRVRSCSVADMAREQVEMLAPQARRLGVELACTAPEGANVHAVDREQLAQVVTNLVLNGAQATGPEGHVTVDVADTPEGVRITVRDTGPGVPRAERERIFEPFYTTKAPGDGTGLGLSIVRRIVTDHGGTIRVGDAAGGGAAMIVDIPHREEE